MAKQDSIKGTGLKRSKKKAFKDMDWASRIAMYNSFCKPLHEGDILYNLDITNMWGSYLLVSVKSIFVVSGIKIYYILLLGLDKEGDEFKPNGIRVSLTPEKLENFVYLKPIGSCKFDVLPKIRNISIDDKLEAIYTKTNLWDYNHKLETRKPYSKRRYDKQSGELIVKSTVQN